MKNTVVQEIASLRESLAAKDLELADLDRQRVLNAMNAADMTRERDQWKARAEAAEADTRIVDWAIRHRTGHICEHNGKFAWYDPQKKTEWFDTPREAWNAAISAQEPPR